VSERGEDLVGRSRSPLTFADPRVKGGEERRPGLNADLKKSPRRMNKKVALATAVLAIMFYASIAPLQASALILPPPGSLIVTVTSPTAGSTVAATVTVKASVSVVGSLTVAGVQFKRDGVNIGTQDTTSPYSVYWNTTTTTNGPHTLTAVARDSLGVLWTSNAVKVTVSNDITRPTVTINQAAGQADPTSTAHVNFTAVFSEAVSGFTGTDVTITGTAGGAKTATVTGGPRTYNVAVSGMTTGGTVIATIAAGVARDAVGNTNTASTSTDNQVIFDLPDTTPPAPPSTPDLAAASDSGVSDADNLTNVTTPTFTGTAETGTTVKIFGDGVQIGSGTAPGGVYTITASSLSDGTRNITATATDAANNVSSSSGALRMTINTTPPTVAVTSPADGATVSGTETVTASASDDVPIAGVQFLLDGNAGTDDTTAPYSIAWDTTHVSDGSHVLTAIARDAAGNRATSAPVNVTVSNDTTPPDVVTRFEETSSAISAGPAGAWVLRGAEVAAFSGGSAGSSNVTGATATFTFTGTAVGWIGLRCSVCGIASVSIDGGTATSVDTAGPAAPGSPGLTSESVFATTGLASGNHTLVITVTGTSTSGGAHIIVDAFDVTGGASAPTRFEETSSAISAGPAGAWVLRGAEVAAFSGGSAGSSDVTGATATFTFAGTSATWIGLRCSVCGIASVSIDGGAATSVDTAGAAAPGSPGLASEAVFTASGLASGNHTLVITVTGTTTSGGAHIVVDAFDVTP
jgi:hypothetical protein